MWSGLPARGYGSSSSQLALPKPADPATPLGGVYLRGKHASMHPHGHLCMPRCVSLHHPRPAPPLPSARPLHTMGGPRQEQGTHGPLSRHSGCSQGGGSEGKDQGREMRLCEMPEGALTCSDPQAGGAGGAALCPERGEGRGGPPSCASLSRLALDQSSCHQMAGSHEPHSAPGTPAAPPWGSEGEGGPEQVGGPTWSPFLPHPICPAPPPGRGMVVEPGRAPWGGPAGWACPRPLG